MARQEFSKKTKAQAFLRCGGRCEDCDMILRPGEPEYDHIICEGMTDGDNSLENCQVLCRICHKAKTKKDKGIIAKSNRIIEQRRGIKKSKWKWPKRKFGHGY